MRFSRIAKFSSSLTKGLLPSQQAALSQVVCALLTCRCLLLAEIARCFHTTTAFPHNLKRVWRFVSNQRLNRDSCKEVVARRALRQLHHRLQLKPADPLKIIIDWTSVWPYLVLQALVPIAGRAVPVLSLAAHRRHLTCRQNTLEQQFIASLRRCVPRHWRVVIVADRGFGRAELLRFIQQQGFSYVIRLKGDAWVKAGRYEGRLRDYPLSVGQCFKLAEVSYHKTKRCRLKLVLNCARVKGKVASWLLATDLGLSAGQVVGIYRERFWCEESFRDQKQEFELEGVRVEQARRLENLLLALAIVLLALAVIGMRAKKLGYGEQLSTRKKKQTVLSWVQVALVLLRESSKFLNLLFESQGAGFHFRWA